jgi:hypothetical protein
MTPSIMTLSIMTLIKMQNIVILNANHAIYAECHIQAVYAECRYAECHYAECRGAIITVQCMEETVLTKMSVLSFICTC